MTLDTFIKLIGWILLIVAGLRSALLVLLVIFKWQTHTLNWIGYLWIVAFFVGIYLVFVRG